MNIRYEGLQWKMDLPDALNAPISRIRLVSPHLPSIYFCAQSYRLHAAHTEALSAILTRGTSFIKSADVAGRTPPAACRLPLLPLCAGSAAERNSIFQGDDVRSANTAACRIGGESRWRAAEVAGMFWPHIMCCDSGAGDNACT